MVWVTSQPGQTGRHCDSAKLNSAYSRIARSSGLTSPASTSRTLSQDTLRHWENTARESTYVCNQAAGLSRCLNKVQQGMQTQLRILHLTSRCTKVVDLEHRNWKLCKNVSAPPDWTGQAEHQRDCKLVPLSPDRTSVWRDSKLLSVSNKCKKGSHKGKA